MASGIPLLNNSSAGLFSLSLSYESSKAVLSGMRLHTDEMEINAIKLKLSL
jgi:hypothetical protein